MTMSSESKRRVQIANRIDEVIALLDSAKMGCYSNDEARVIVNVTKASTAMEALDDLITPTATVEVYTDVEKEDL